MEWFARGWAAVMTVIVVYIGWQIVKIVGGV